MQPSGPDTQTDSESSESDFLADRTISSCEHVTEVLGPYLDGALPTKLSDQVAQHLQQCDTCFDLLARIQEEDELLLEALSELRPDPSFRAKVAQLCAEALERARLLANALPERSWAAFRWGLAFLAVAHFMVLTLILEPLATHDQVAATDLNWLLNRHSLYFWSNAAVFIGSLFLLIGGRLVASFMRPLTNRLTGNDRPWPTRLEVLALEALGLCGVIAASIFHAMFLRG